MITFARMLATVWLTSWAQLTWPPWCLASRCQIHLVFQHNGAAYLIFLPPHFSTITAVSAWHYMHITRYKFEKLRRNKFRIYAKAVDIICLLSHPLGCISPWCSQHRAATQCMAAAATQADTLPCVMQSLAARDLSLSSAAQIIAVVKILVILKLLWTFVDRVCLLTGQNPNLMSVIQIAIITLLLVIICKCEKLEKQFFQFLQFRFQVWFFSYGSRKV